MTEFDNGPKLTELPDFATFSGPNLNINSSEPAIALSEHQDLLSEGHVSIVRKNGNCLSFAQGQESENPSMGIRSVRYNVSGENQPARYSLTNFGSLPAENQVTKADLAPARAMTTKFNYDGSVTHAFAQTA